MTGYIKEMRELIGNRPLLLVGTSVIAYRDGMILLQKRADNGEWGYPGGYLELGETVEESAQREFLEETGLIANRLELYGVFSGRDKHIVYPNGHEVYCVDVVFTCRDFSPGPVMMMKCWNRMVSYRTTRRDHLLFCVLERFIGSAPLHQQEGA